VTEPVVLVEVADRIATMMVEARAPELLKG
jgi:hypothetical protein